MVKIKLRPELRDFKYWLHVVIIALVMQFLLAKLGHDTGGLLTIHTVHFSLALVVGDILTHTLLRLD